jgi:hypothetical protein
VKVSIYKTVFSEGTRSHYSFAVNLGPIKSWISTTNNSPKCFMAPAFRDVGMVLLQGEDGEYFTRHVSQITSPVTPPPESYLAMLFVALGKVGLLAEQAKNRETYYRRSGAQDVAACASS